MGNFNKGAPEVLGMEPRWQGQYSLTLTDGVGVLQRIVPGADTIRKIHLYAQQLSGTNPGLAVELLSDPMPIQDVGEYFPAVDVTTTGWETQANGTSSLFATVDDQNDITDYIRNNGAIGPNERRALAFRGTATAITGKRVLAVVLTCNARMAQFRDTHNAKVRGFIDISGTRYYGGDVLWPNDWLWHQPDFIAGWIRNPATQKPWTLAEINSIVATGSTNKFGLDVTVSPDTYNQIDDNGFSIAGVKIGVLQANENRTGTTGQGSSYGLVKPRLGWDAVQLTADATTSANTFYWIFASAYGGGATSQNSAIVIPRFNDDHGTIAFTDDASSSTGEARQWLAAQLKSGAVHATIPAREAPITTGAVGAIPFLVENSSGTINACSQPYAQLQRADIHVSSLANRGQRYTPGANKTYGIVLATCGWGSYNMPSQPLIVQVRSAINGGSLLGTAILHPDPDDTWVRDRYLLLDTAIAAVNGTPLFIHFLSSTLATKPWRILQYDTRSDNIKSGSATTTTMLHGATVGGSTDGYFESGALNVRYDLACALIASPDAPTMTITSVDAT